MEKTKEIIAMIPVRNRRGEWEIAPEFPEHGCYFHPIAKFFPQGAIKPGIVLEGYFGVCHDSGNLDARGKKIYIRYFIPIRVRKATFQDLMN